MSNTVERVNYWMMDDPSQPKPADILAVLIDFRDDVAGRFRSVEGRLDRVEGRLTAVEGRLAGVERGLVGVDQRLASLERRRKR